MITEIIITSAVCIGILMVLFFVLRLILLAIALGLSVKKRELLDDMYKTNEEE